MGFTKEEFFAFILLYAAKADFIESAAEKAFILNKVTPEVYGKVHRIFDNLTDAERIELMLENVRTHNYKQSSADELLEEIKALMTSDGELAATETMVLVGIRRLIRSA